jgi:adenine-specific DNA-methyltransferase
MLLLFLSFLGDLFEVKRGIATGNNNFFVLSQEKIEKHDIPSELLIPLIPSPRYLSVNEIESESNGNPKVNKRIYLLNCGHLSMKDIETQYPTVAAYLKKGMSESIHEGYLCKHRKPWYKLESREPALFLLTYMGRKTSTKENPIHFIRNSSKAVCLNQYMMLYPKTKLSDSQVDVVWKYLKELDLYGLKDKARYYAGGLMKMEPSEVKKISLFLPENFNV